MRTFVREGNRPHAPQVCPRVPAQAVSAEESGMAGSWQQAGAEARACTAPQADAPEQVAPLKNGRGRWDRPTCPNRPGRSRRSPRTRAEARPRISAARLVQERAPDNAPRVMRRSVRRPRRSVRIEEARAVDLFAGWASCPPGPRSEPVDLGVKGRVHRQSRPYAEGMVARRKGVRCA